MPSLRKFLSRLAILVVCGILLSQLLPPWTRTRTKNTGRFGSPLISETLVVACKDTDDMSWLEYKQFKVENITVSRSTKGNEALAYLNYIIENYDHLTDLTIFIHNQDQAWHNSRLFNRRMSRMLAHLDRAFVKQQGYFNLRCDWDPGCPSRFNFSSSTAVLENNGVVDKPDRENNAMRESWTQLHPGHPLPTNLGQPCCSQFAASRERIRLVPLERWTHYRDWVLETPLINWFAGRVWEYTWQYILAGDRVATWCPTEIDCLCFGYGICFGGKSGWEAWKKLEKDTEALRHDYMTFRSRGREDIAVKQKLLDMENEAEEMLAVAIARGKREQRWRKAEDFSF